MEICQEDSFECCRRLVAAGYRPLVLDFASSTNPGGSWRSKQVGTQEESLCRRSNLGILLEQSRAYPIARDGLLYVANVKIQRDSNGSPIVPMTCACVASELKGISSSTEQYLLARVDALYQCALAHRHDCLVLGLWGCGAFSEADDDAMRLAKAMKVIRKRYADRVKTVYAILGRERVTSMFREHVA